MARITITGPKSITLPASMGGNDTIFGLVVIATTRGIFVKELGGDKVEVAGISDLDLVTPAIVKQLLAVGCEVTGYPIYFEVDDLTAEVPADFPNRTYQQADESDPEADPVETPHTWQTYFDGMPGHDPQTIGGKNYVSSVNTWDRGRPLPASLWGDLKLVSVSDFAALQPAGE